MCNKPSRQHKRTLQLDAIGSGLNTIAKPFADQPSIAQIRARKLVIVWQTIFICRSVVTDFWR